MLQASPALQLNFGDCDLNPDHDVNHDQDLKTSTIECQTIPLINTLDRYSHDTPSTSPLTLNTGSTSWSTVGRELTHF